MNENKLKKIFNKTLINGELHEGKLRDLQCSDLMIDSANRNKNYRYGVNNLCMFKYKYHDIDSILMIFAIPIKSKEDDRRFNIRFFELLIDIEKSFVALDYRQLLEFKEDEYMYFVCVKMIDEEEEEL